METLLAGVILGTLLGALAGIVVGIPAKSPELAFEEILARKETVAHEEMLSGTFVGTFVAMAPNEALVAGAGIDTCVDADIGLGTSASVVLGTATGILISS